MKNYHPCSANRSDLPAEANCTARTFQGRRALPPFFDIPCLYHPQYPQCPHPHPNLSDNPFAVFQISGDGNDHLSLTLTQDIQKGRSIRLQSSTSILLQPNYLYQLSYHVNAKVDNTLGICPILDGEPDSGSASYSAGPVAVSSMQSVSNTILLPVVETASSVELQFQTAPIALADMVNGSVYVLALAQL